MSRSLRDASLRGEMGSDLSISDDSYLSDASDNLTLRDSTPGPANSANFNDNYRPKNKAGSDRRATNTRPPTPPGNTYASVMYTSRNDDPWGGYAADPNTAAGQHRARALQRISEVDIQFPSSGEYAHQTHEGYLQPWERSYPENYQADYDSGSEYAVGGEYAVNDRQQAYQAQQDVKPKREDSRDMKVAKDSKDRKFRDGKAGETRRSGKSRSNKESK